MSEFSDETRFLKRLHLMKAVTAPSYRKLPQALGSGQGKASHRVRALFDKNLVQMPSFYQNDKIRACVFRRPQASIVVKPGMIRNFLKIKLKKYQMLRHNISRLRREVIS